MGEPSGDPAALHPRGESFRSRLDVRRELVLALFPTLMILAVLGLLEMFTRQRLLFASLASSAFLVYLDPRHTTNAVRTLIISHLLAAVVGFAADHLFGLGYFAAGTAMVITIAAMILLDIVHPPAVATSMSFAFREADDRNLWLFALALGMIGCLVLLQRVMLWLFARLQRPEISGSAGPRV